MSNVECALDGPRLPQVWGSVVLPGTEIPQAQPMSSACPMCDGSLLTLLTPARLRTSGVDTLDRLALDRLSVCALTHTVWSTSRSLWLTSRRFPTPTTVPQGAATQPHARKAFTSPPRLSTSCRCQSWPLQSDPKRRPPWWICPPRLHSS